MYKFGKKYNTETKQSLYLMVDAPGIEPGTSRLSGVHSNQLS